ncbi:MAG TPA: terminase, partial [Chloroflexota bacterium]|nr:terminase [Chloroflexota bacterium]
NPFCWQAWAIAPDGRAYRYQEIYRAKVLVEDHARRILALTAGQPVPRAVVCDHDAEDRATLEKHLRLRTVPAYKAIGPGVQAVAARLRVAGDGRPRLFLVRDALVERDRELEEARRPCCSEEEVDGYVWPKGADGKQVKEQPLGVDDHGMDCWRYLIAQLDLVGGRRAVGKARAYAS